MILQVVSQSTKNRTYGWVPPQGVVWYLFFAHGARVSNSPPVSESGVVKKTIQFSKGTEPHEVAAIIRTSAGFMRVDVGIYPPESSSDVDAYNVEEYSSASYGH